MTVYVGALKDNWKVTFTNYRRRFSLKFTRDHLRSAGSSGFIDGERSKCCSS